MAERCQQEGFLTKSHAGAPFAKESQKRWFETIGFTVCYYRDNSKKSLKGHFDLRNVDRIQPVTDEADKAAAGAEAVNLSISEEGKAPKVMTLSFKESASGDRDKWLTLWCSAVAAKSVDPQLTRYIDSTLTAELNEKYGDREAVSRQRSAFGSQVATTKVLTPRGSANASDSSKLDTPRAAPPAPAPAKDDAAPTTFEITVPDGVKPGDRLQATTPSGTKVKLVVPEGAEPGMLLTFQVPKNAGKKKKPSTKDKDAAADALAQEKSAIAIQKRLRGIEARKRVAKPSVAEPEMTMTRQDDPLAQAATKLQSSFRGLRTRNKQQEDARLQWLRYYVDAEEWEQASGLAISAEEEEMISAKKAEAEELALSKPDGPEEQRRKEWLKYFILKGDFDKAAEMSVGEFDQAQVLKGRALAAARCFSCMPQADIEMDRQQQFHAAIQQSKFELAEVLALTAEEMQDVADSRDRVDLFEKAMADGNFIKAQEYAILNKEEDRVRNALKANGSDGTAAEFLVTSMSVTSSADPREKAALKVQAIVRGHQTRDQQEEDRRQQWLRYYAAEGQLDEASKLAIKPAEIAAVQQMKGGDIEGGKHALALAIPEQPASAPAAATSSASTDEFIKAIKAYHWEAAAKFASIPQDKKDLANSKARMAYMSKYICDNNSQQAKSLAITEAEVARIDWELNYRAKLADGVEADAFTQAIKENQWTFAAQLAETDLQRQDLVDSQARVKYLYQHIYAKEWDLAREMAITPEEEMLIKDAREGRR